MADDEVRWVIRKPSWFFFCNKNNNLNFFTVFLRWYDKGCSKNVRQ